MVFFNKMCQNDPTLHFSSKLFFERYTTLPFFPFCAHLCVLINYVRKVVAQKMANFLS
jgi:hypothetical protein